MQEVLHMNSLDAAHLVLCEKGQWMHVRDLAQELLDRGLFMSQAKNPVNSLRATLSMAIRKTSNPRGFVRHGPMIGLREWGPGIPPPDDAVAPPQVIESSLPLSEEQILAIKKTLPSDQFEELFGDIWQRYQERRRWRLITEVTTPELLQAVRREISRIQDYLLEQGRQAPKPEVIANWIVFCYQLELYREGAALIQHIGPDQIGEDLYHHLHKIAQACGRHIKR
jgi:hypothetical protein